MQQLSEQEIIRRDNLQKIKDLGINPFPSEKYDVTHKSSEIVENYKEGGTD